MSKRHHLGHFVILTWNMSQPIINLTMYMENMRINVAQLLKEPVGASRSYGIEEYVGKDDINSVEGDVVLIRSGNAIIVKGKMTASVKVVCSRCLKPIDCEVTFDFEEEALPILTEDLSSSVQYDNLIIDESHILDLSEAVRQYAWLTVPAKPLCFLDCAGICQTCGHDLNQEPCKCPSNVKIHAGLNWPGERRI
jgi:DUF177 domain-containing protein